MASRNTSRLMGASGLWKGNLSGPSNYLSESLELWRGKIVGCGTDRWHVRNFASRGSFLRRWRRVLESFRGVPRRI